jgi:hemerythrin-like domain-containing protein
MSKETTPIKRSRQLSPLSRDHHQGLLLAWKIRQGIKNGTDKIIIADYIKWFWLNELEEHFREEEEILAPYLKDNEMIQRMFKEHHRIKSIIHNDHLVDEGSLTELALLVNDHIRFEERELFPLAEKMIKEEDLDRIELDLIKEKKTCGVWENEFWLRK